VGVVLDYCFQFVVQHNSQGERTSTLVKRRS
jgi:hypothetical protein